MGERESQISTWSDAADSVQETWRRVLFHCQHGKLIVKYRQGVNGTPPHVPETWRRMPDKPQRAVNRNHLVLLFPESSPRTRADRRGADTSTAVPASRPSRTEWKQHPGMLCGDGIALSLCLPKSMHVRSTVTISQPRYSVLPWHATSTNV